MAREDDIVFKEYPLWLWLTGTMTTIVALLLPLTFWEHALFLSIGLALIAFPSILSVTVDRGHETLALRYRSLFRTSMQIFRFDEIAGLNISEDSEGERMYRVELVLQSGRVIPLQYGFSIGRARKERRARRLRDALAIGNWRVSAR